jgi:hypothetical protein
MSDAPSPAPPLFRAAGFSGAAREFPRSELAIYLLCAFNGIERQIAPKTWEFHPNEWSRDAWERVADAAEKHFAASPEVADGSPSVDKPRGHQMEEGFGSPPFSPEPDALKLAENALVAFNVKPDAIVGGMSDALVVRLPISAFVAAEKALAAIRAAREGRE